jgi:hypothetical protein
MLYFLLLKVEIHALFAFFISVDKHELKKTRRKEWVKRVKILRGAIMKMVLQLCGLEY